MIIKDLNIGDLFSFSKKGPVHMVIKNCIYLEYKGFSDGKIRVYHNLKRIVFKRDEWEKIYENKWFNPML